MTPSTHSKPLWSCAQTDAHHLAYLQDTLDEAHAQLLFEHMLSCPRCYSRYSQVQAEEVVEEALSLLDALTEEPSATNSPHRLQETYLDDTPSPAAGLLLPKAPPSTSPWQARSDEFEALPETGACLEVIGTVLPALPKTELYAGYQLFLGEGMPQPQRSRQSAAQLQLKVSETGKATWTLKALSSEVYVQEEPLAKGQALTLEGVKVVLCGSFCYRLQLSEQNEPSLLWHVGPRFPLELGELGVGRDPQQASLVLPDRPSEGQLLLRGTQAGPLTGLDAYQVSRKHAVIRWDGQQGQLQGLVKAPVYAFRDGIPHTSSESHPPVEFGREDILQLGWVLFRVRS